MTLRNILVPALLFLAACADDAPTNMPASNVSDQEKIISGQSEDRGVHFYGLTQDLNRSSDLAQINTVNIKNLTPVWTLALGEKIGLQTQPLVIGNVMYVTTHNSTHAIDAATGRQIWKTVTEYAENALNCCGYGNRGLAYHDGKLYRTNIDNRIIVFNPDNGEILWEKEVHDVTPSYSMTSAPLVANGVLVTGIGGSEFAAPGFIDGWDPDTGEHLWRLHTIPKPGEPGSETWEGDDWKRGGGGTWLTGSYDAELDLVYWGVANPAPWSAHRRAGDNLYTNSMLAIKPRTGEMVWYFQFTPNDTGDYDGNNEPLLTELKIGGELRKVLIQANRNGFFYVLDRTNGEFITANAFVEKTTWTAGIDAVTGRPERSESVEHMLKTGEPTEVWPTAFGGKNLAPMSYSKRTGLAYINAINTGWVVTPVDQEFREGVLYFSIDFEFVDSSAPTGELKAIDPLSGRIKWSFPTETAMNGGTLVTAGNLVFSGAQTGELYALHAETGEKLWEYRTGSGIVAPPVTYQVGGKQYVAVASGIGGLYAAVSGDPNLVNINPGNSIWAFALNDGAIARTPVAKTILPPLKSTEVGSRTMPATAEAGKLLYHQYCAHCHGVDRMASGTNYDLRQFPEDDEQRFVSAIVDGKGTMPGWGDTFSREELSAIYSYVTH